MTAKEFKKSNHYRCTFAYVFGGPTCACCRKHRVTFAMVRFYDNIGKDYCCGKEQLWCHACGFRGFRTFNSCTCDSWEQVHDSKRIQEGESL